MVFPASWISLLVVMNLSLQVWDGLATYYGLSHGVQEGNPLLRACMEYWGAGVTLVGAKSAACVFLVYLREVTSLRQPVGPRTGSGQLHRGVSPVLVSRVPSVANPPLPHGAH